MPIWLQIFFAVITCVCAVFNVIIGIMTLRNKKKTQIIEKYLNNKFNVNIDKRLENHNETTNIYCPQISNNNGYSFKDVSYFLEQQQRIKINKIVSKACETTTINVINDKLKDLNWAYAFFNDSKNSSEEIIMDIWANVLAGKNKATFKLLNFLSNMNSIDAKLFMEILPLFCGTTLIKKC